MSVLTFDGGFVFVLKPLHDYSFHLFLVLTQPVVSSPFSLGSTALLQSVLSKLDRTSISDYDQLQHVSLCRGLRSVIIRLSASRNLYCAPYLGCTAVACEALMLQKSIHGVS